MTTTQQAVADVLTNAEIPDGDTNALVLVVTRQGVKGVLSTKIGEHWQVDTVVGVSADKKIDGGIQLKATWG